jgi:phosphoribosylformimino-5-aminoimidazole carboxamide ribotide isomerase
MARAYPGRLLLGLDARDGRVAAQGWLEVSSVAALALAQEFDPLPLAGIIYTDIARDGTLEGPNLSAIAALAQAVHTPIIASGGVGKLEDLERLARLPIAGCIVGRALYEGRFSLGEALQLSHFPGDQTP